MTSFGWARARVALLAVGLVGLVDHAVWWARHRAEPSSGGWRFPHPR